MNLFFPTSARSAIGYRLSAIACASALVGLALSAALAAEEKWTDLFDGKTLTGWVQRGGKAQYEVKDGCIVGTTVLNTPNSFICTEKEYGDFILELEFKVDSRLNSGVQIRSHCFEQETSLEAVVQEAKKKGNDAPEPKMVKKTIKIPAGRVHGYQVEIDPSSRAWSGGIYDEGRRGWLNDLSRNEPARKAFKQDEWNKYRIECRGDSIKTWINGVPAADLKDSLTPKGFIALQVHGAKEAGHQARFRNIRIQEL
jgi:hypothetical protein